MTAPSTDTGVTTTKPDLPAIVKRDIEAAADQFLKVLPKGMDAERFRQVCEVAIIRNPQLLQCAAWARGRASLKAALIDAAEAGLEPTGSLSRAWLVPFREKHADPYPLCQLMIGYQGYADLMRDSGKIKRVTAEVVYEGDEYHVEKGLNPTLRHVPAGLTDDPNKITNVYAIAWYADGSTQFEPMTRAQVEKIRAKSRSGNSPAWLEAWDQMARKTAIRRLKNYVPLSERAVAAFQKDDEREFAGPSLTPQVPSASAALREQMAAHLAKNVTPVEDPPEPPAAPTEPDPGEPVPSVSPAQENPVVQEDEEKAHAEVEAVTREMFEDQDPWDGHGDDIKDAMALAATRPARRTRR